MKRIKALFALALTLALLCTAALPAGALPPGYLPLTTPTTTTIVNSPAAPESIVLPVINLTYENSKGSLGNSLVLDDNNSPSYAVHKYLANLSATKRLRHDVMVYTKTISGDGLQLDIALSELDALINHPTQGKLINSVTAGTTKTSINMKRPFIEALLKAAKDVDLSNSTLRFTITPLGTIWHTPIYDIRFAMVKDGQASFVNLDFSAMNQYVTVKYPFVVDDSSTIRFIPALYINGWGQAIEGAYDQNSGSIIAVTNIAGQYTLTGFGGVYYARSISQRLLDTATSLGIYISAIPDFNGITYPTGTISEAEFTQGVNNLIARATPPFTQAKRFDSISSAALTRDKAAAIIYSTLRSKGLTLSAMRGVYHYNDMDDMTEVQERLSSAGLLVPDSSGSYNRKNTVTYGEAAIILQRLYLALLHPQTAQGWALAPAADGSNSAGYSQYWSIDGTYFTGTKTVSGKSHKFGELGMVLTDER